MTDFLLMNYAAGGILGVIAGGVVVTVGDELDDEDARKIARVALGALVFGVVGILVCQLPKLVRTADLRLPARKKRPELPEAKVVQR